MDAFNGLTKWRREESNSAKAATLVVLRRSLVISLEELMHRDWIELVSGLSSIL